MPVGLFVLGALSGLGLAWDEPIALLCGAVGAVLLWGVPRLVAAATVNPLDVLLSELREERDPEAGPPAPSKGEFRP